MPARPWPLWVLTGLLLVGFPTLNLIYWSEVLRSGFLPTYGDSIGIPIGVSVIVTLVASPLVLGITWFCLRRYNPQTRFAAWRPDRPYRTAIATLAFAGSAALLVAILAAGVATDLALDLRWYEHLFYLYLGLWLPWLLGLRAAVIEQLEYEPTYTER